MPTTTLPHDPVDFDSTPSDDSIIDLANGLSPDTSALPLLGIIVPENGHIAGLVARDHTTEPSLEVLRYVTLRCSSHPAASQEWTSTRLALARESGYRWLRFLLSEDSSSQAQYLQQERSRDAALYDPATLRPLPSAPSRFLFEHFKWLKQPEHLTITELEVALAVFEWNVDDPRLNGWLREHPQILWRVDVFFLRRYALEMSGYLRVARQAEDRRRAAIGMPGVRLDSPPYRAGEFARWRPRVAGLVTIGMLALLGYDGSMALVCSELSTRSAILFATALLVLNFLLIYIDVYKQNRGVMGDGAHGVRRTLAMLRWFFAWGAVDLALLGTAALVLSGDGAQACWAAARLGDVIRLLASATVFILAACAIGMLVQWFWEDKSAAEPV